ncbi:acyloxyacyl hydrolase [Arcobacter sp. CECT 8983]|uniref:acyloxyacyl hydrolase n=1 Tax=Arcobacter sp. CECT 8983 TaxID=2044508 RepID=UPI0013E91E0F|nr:acyloxyacyl hydrolase [Arcobacter sp. CECT 8983]
MKKLILILFLFISSLYSFDKVALEYGTSNHDIDIYGISVIKDINYEIIKDTNLSWEFTLQDAEGKKDDMVILSTQPMLNHFFNEKIYFELGLGVAYFSQKHLDNEEYGTHFQFKESAGFGYKFTDTFDITLKYTHYSNANINNKNAGIDLIGARLVYKF